MENVKQIAMAIASMDAANLVTINLPFEKSFENYGCKENTRVFRA